jgi:hypothetical protein
MVLVLPQSVQFGVRKPIKHVDNTLTSKRRNQA